MNVTSNSNIKGPVRIPEGNGPSTIGWLRLYARERLNAPDYYKRGRMWAVAAVDVGQRTPVLYVAYSDTELQRLLDEEPGASWWEANIIDIEASLGYELESED